MNSVNITANSIIDSILDIVQSFRESQMGQVELTSRKLSEALLAGGIIHVFGAGHSRTFGMEMCGRAGGLVPMNLIGLEDVARVDQSGINLVELERDPHTAHRLLEIHDVRTEDAMIIVSNSGRNGSAVEMALECRKRGIAVIAVTSLQSSEPSSSRHPSGKRLFEAADIVIDNCGPFGDVLLDIPGMSEKTGSSSTVVGALIAQALTTGIISRYLELGEAPPVYISANVDGGDEHNRQLVQKYAHRNITY